MIHVVVHDEQFIGTLRGLHKKTKAAYADSFVTQLVTRNNHHHQGFF